MKSEFKAVANAMSVALLVLTFIYNANDHALGVLVFYVVAIHCIFFAFPAYLLLRKFDLTRWWVGIAAGFVVGWIPISLIMLKEDMMSRVHAPELALIIRSFFGEDQLIFAINGAVAGGIAWSVWYVMFGRTNAA